MPDFPDPLKKLSPDKKRLLKLVQEIHGEVIGRAGQSTKTASTRVKIPGQDVNAASTIVKPLRRGRGSRRDGAA